MKQVIRCVALGALLTTGFASCGKPPAADPAARGAEAYRLYCTACHHRNPTLDRPEGPALAGASLELLRAKVMENEYPQGYRPKRDTRIMRPLRHLKPNLPDLAAFLAASKK